MMKRKKTIITFATCLLLVMSAVVAYLVYTTPRTATYGGYYEPLTIYFNKRNSMSLFNRSLMEKLKDIDFRNYYVKSLYPLAKVTIVDTEYGNVYIWKLKLKEPLAENYPDKSQGLEEIKIYSNYPFPKEMTYYRWFACPTLILGVDKSRYAFLIQITDES